MRSSVAPLLVLVATGCGGGGAPPVRGGDVVFTRYHGSHGTVWIGPRRLGPGFGGVVSPDRRWIAVAARGRRIEVVDSRDRRRVSARGDFLDWSPDSRRVLVTTGTALRVVDVATRTVRTIDTDRGEFYGASFSANGHRVAFARGRRAARESPCDAGPDLFTVGADGGARRRLTGDGRSEFPVWGRYGIAFARLGKRCATFTSDVRLLDPRTRRTRRLATSPPNYAGGGYYGLLPLAWIPRRPLLLVGVNGEFGRPGLVVRLRDGAMHDLRWSACGPIPDGRRLVVMRSGAEGPYFVGTVSVDGRDRRVVARGDVSC